MDSVSAAKIFELELTLRGALTSPSRRDPLSLSKGLLGGSSHLEASLLALVIGGLGREAILENVRAASHSDFEQSMQHKVADIWALEMALRSLVLRSWKDRDPAVLSACVRLARRLLEVLSSTLIHFGLDSELPISSCARGLTKAVH